MATPRPLIHAPELKYYQVVPVGSLELLKSLGSHCPTKDYKVALVYLHTEWCGVAIQEASTTINCAYHWCFLLILNAKTPLDGKSTPVQVGNGGRSYLSVNEAPNTTSSNVDKRIRTIYLP